MSVPPPQTTRRVRALVGLGVVVAAAVLAAAIHWYANERNYEVTDDAYVGGNVVQITAQIPGVVVSIGADDTEFVAAGQPVVVLNDADTRLALAQAEAELAHAVRRVRAAMAETAGSRANLSIRETEVAKATADLERRGPLGHQGAISTEEVEHARSSVNAAEAALVSAKQQWLANAALIAGTRVEDHPDVLRAAIGVREAYLAERRTVLCAPVSGYIARRNVQVGQRVQPGVALLAIVPLDHLWVDANFKESQLKWLRIGQPVTINVDVYGGETTYTGRVLGLAAGTGAAFAVLPPQNAAGNWIKIVQRLPVRVSIDGVVSAEYPLRLGLSARVRVDISLQSGLRLSREPRSGVAYRTPIFESEGDGADLLVRRIIAAGVTAASGATDFPQDGETTRR